MAGASRKEYELLFALKASLGSNFNSVFKEADSSMKALKSALGDTNQTAGKIDGYQKAEQSLNKTKEQLTLFNQENEKLIKTLENVQKPTKEQINELKNYKERIQNTEKTLSTYTTEHINLLKAMEGVDNPTEKQIKQLKNSEAQIKKTKKELGYYKTDYNELEKTIKVMEDAEANQEKQLKRNEEQIKRTNESIDKQEQRLGELTIELKDVGIDTENLTGENEKLKKSFEDLSKSKKHIEEITAAQEKNKQAVSETRDMLLKVTGLYAAAGMAVYKGAIEPAIEFESAFAGVMKTVDGTPEELAAIREEILQMSVLDVPAAANEIAAVAEAAGQLGIQTGNITDFSKAMIDLGESTNLSATEAAENLAKYANITGMSQDYFNNLGSTIVELGNKYATNENDIVRMSMRIASAGSQIGLTDAQIMAFSASLSSVGMEAEAGGSAFSRTMIEMQLAAELGAGKAKEAIEKTGMSLEELEWLKDTDGKGFKVLAEEFGYTSKELKGFVDKRRSLDDFARVAGTDADKFAVAFRENAGEAVISFITGLSKMDEEGISAIATLDEMGFTGINLRDTLMKSTNAQELFSQAQKTANEAWEDNTALSKEAAQRYDTTESKIQMMKNAVDELGIVTGDLALPVVRDAVSELSNMIRGATDFVRQNPETVKQIASTAIEIGKWTFGGLGALFAAQKLQGGFLGVAKVYDKVKIAFKAADVAKEGKKFGAFASTLMPLTKGLGLYTGIAAGAVVVTAAVVAALWAQHEAAVAVAKEYSDTFLYNTGGLKLSDLTQALKDGTSDSFNFAKSINSSGEELKLIKDNVAEARREVEIYGTVLRENGILNSEEAERLKEPFENLITALESGFSIRYNNVFTAFKDAAIRAADGLGANVAEIETILDNFKNKYDENISSSRLIISEHLDKISLGEKTTEKENENFQKEMAYLKDAAKIESGAYLQYQKQKDALSSLDFGENEVEALQNLKDFQEYAGEYLKEIDNAQKQLEDDYKNIRNISENDLKYDKISRDEYNAQIEALNAAQSITHEQYLKDRQDFIDESSNIMTEAQSALNIAKHEFANGIEGIKSEAIDLRAGIQSLFDYISKNVFGIYNGETYESRSNQYKRETAEKEYSEHQTIIKETRTILQSDPVNISIQKAAQHDTDIYNSFLPAYATGTNYTASDTFLAGELGPEIVTAQKGMKVYTAEETANIMNSYKQVVMFLPQMKAHAEMYSPPAVEEPNVRTPDNNVNINVTMPSHSFNISGEFANELQRKLDELNEEFERRAVEAIEQHTINDYRVRFKK